MITFAVEKMADVLEEIQPLLEQHYQEVALNKNRAVLAPDWGRYEAAEAARALAVYTARDGGTLVGYSVWLINWHLHYKFMLVASNDVFYVRPDRRAPRVALRLIEFSEERLREAQVDRVVYHVKYGKVDFSPLLQRLGYRDEEKIVGKTLGG